MAGIFHRDVATDRQRPLANIKVADKPTYPHPVLSGNRLFVEDDDSVGLLTLD